MHLPTSTPSFPLLGFPWGFLLNQYGIYMTQTDFTDERTSCFSGLWTTAVCSVCSIDQRCYDFQSDFFFQLLNFFNLAAPFLPFTIILLCSQLFLPKTPALDQKLVVSVLFSIAIFDSANQSDKNTVTKESENWAMMVFPQITLPIYSTKSKLVLKILVFKDNFI